jgi:hypothetical protein
MAAGRPIVTTEIAAEEISADRGSEFAVVPFGDAHVDEVTRLLDALDRRSRSDSKICDYTKRNHT